MVPTKALHILSGAGKLKDIVILRDFFFKKVECIEWGSSSHTFFNSPLVNDIYHAKIVLQALCDD